MRRTFGAAARGAKLPAGFWPYDLRHSRITLWAEAGHSVALIQAAAGHRSAQATLRHYIHVNAAATRVLFAPGDPVDRAGRAATA